MVEDPVENAHADLPFRVTLEVGKIRVARSHLEP